MPFVTTIKSKPLLLLDVGGHRGLLYYGDIRFCLYMACKAAHYAL